MLGSPAFFSRDLMWTVMMSQEDQRHHPNDRLLDLALAAAAHARRVDLTWLAERASAEERDFVGHWPGEHYRLLAACVEHLRPRLVVEIGTFTGLSALAAKAHLPADGRVVTYDIAPWWSFPDAVLDDSDLDDRLEQRLGDLGDSDFFATQVETLAEADLMLLDGPKDGRFEPKFLQLYLPIFRSTDTVLVVDDIRFVNMIQLWRDLPHPKLDLTSFGHWTGTGSPHAKAGPRACRHQPVEIARGGRVRASDKRRSPSGQLRAQSRGVRSWSNRPAQPPAGRVR
ncbi:MAG: class I SAM-dependent methyltransferase [Streptosporangiaceae bacterium]